MQKALPPNTMAEALPKEPAAIVARRRVRYIRPNTFSLFLILSQMRELGRYFDLFRTLSKHRIRVRYKQSMLGLAWAVLQPLSLMLIFTVMFSYLTKVPTNGAPYSIFVFVGLLPWTYFSTALTTSTNSLVSHINLITKVYFPREILPLTYVIAAFFDFLIASSMLVLMMLYYKVPVTLNALYVVPIITVLTIFVIAMALLFSTIQVRYRDVGVGLPLLLQIWMFATPVVYPLSTASKLPVLLKALYTLNPMVGVIENFRRAVLEGASPDFVSLGISFIISALLLPFAYLYFKRAEATVADIV
jgi:lipopolysaccharide transport system permease protein